MVKELRDLISRYNTKHESNLNLSLDELIYVVVRLADSIRQNPNHKEPGYAALVKELRRRLYDHLNSGAGYGQQNPPTEEQTP